MRGMSRGHLPAPRPSLVPLIVHVIMIAVVLAYAAASGFVYTTPDANIGLALGGFGFVALGLPWSLAYLVLPDQDQGLINVFAAGGVGTLLNLGLHIYLWRRKARRMAIG